MKPPGRVARALCFLAATAFFAVSSGLAENVVPLYGVHELTFRGPAQKPGDAPARDVELVTTWRGVANRADLKSGCAGSRPIMGFRCARTVPPEIFDRRY